MKRKLLIAAILVSLFSGVGVQANAAEKNVTHVVSSSPNLSTLVSLASTTINDIKARKTFEFSTPKGTYISLGESFFSNLENQGVSLNSGLGACITDNRGCWSSDYGMYLPLLVDKTKLSAFQVVHSSSIDARVRGAGSGNAILGIVGLVSAVAAGVVLVVSAPVLSVVGVATTVGLFAAVIGGYVTACQNLAGRCR